MNPQDQQGPQGTQTPTNAPGSGQPPQQQPPAAGQTPPPAPQNPAPNPSGTPPVVPPTEGMQPPAPTKSKTGLWLLVAVIVALVAASYLLVTAL